MNNKRKLNEHFIMADSNNFCELCKKIYEKKESRYSTNYKEQTTETTLSARLQLFDINVSSSGKTVCRKCFRQVDKCEEVCKILQRWRESSNKENIGLKRNRSPSIKFTPGFLSKKSRAPLKDGLENLTFDITDYDVIDISDEGSSKNSRENLFQKVSINRINTNSINLPSHPKLSLKVNFNMQRYTQGIIPF